MSKAERIADWCESRFRWNTLWRSRAMGLVAGPFRLVEFWQFAGGRDWYPRGNYTRRFLLAWTMYICRYWIEWRCQ